MNFKKTAILVLVVLAIGGYIVYLNFSSSAVMPVASSETLSPNSIQPQTSGSKGDQGKGTASRQNSKYKDGSYTGQTADAFYGPIQVVAVIQGGKISDVQFLQYPNGAGHSIEVSNFSLPQLKQEAIQSQSSNVDIVSGATQTSQAFLQSLQSALSQAM